MSESFDDDETANVEHETGGKAGMVKIVDEMSEVPNEPADDLDPEHAGAGQESENLGTQDTEGSAQSINLLAASVGYQRVPQAS